MKLPSADGRCTITAWDDYQFEWHDRNYDTCRLTDGGGDPPEWVHMGGRTGAFPREAIAWLNGERTPPPEPIKAGDMVLLGDSPLHRKVLCVDADMAWLKGGDYLVSVDRLRRVSDG